MKAPLQPPESGASQQHFELERVDFGAAEASGRVGGVQAGFPLWSGIWTIGAIGEARSDEWRSFFSELRGAIRAFYGSDKRRPYPKAYPAGFAGMSRAAGGSFTGSATAWSQSIDANDDQLLALAGLPNNFVLTTGDYVGFKWTATSEGVAGLEWRTVVRVIRGGGSIANSSGNMTVKVEPPIPNCVPAGAIAHLDNPACVMRQIIDQSKLNPIDRRGAVTGGTLAAIQDLRA